MTDEAVRPEDKTVPFFPDHFMTELRLTIVLIAIVVAIGALGQIHSPELGEPADPFNTPLHIKPEWYFLSVYQLVKYVPKTVGVLIPIAAVVLLAVWPFLDRRPDSGLRQVRFRAAGTVVLLVALAVLSYLGGQS